jgi:hypothetical protein
VSNDFGEELSNSATLTVVTNTPPTPVILTPAGGTAYVGGQNFSYQGNATDAESGTLPASAFTWRVDFHHDEHQHPFVPDTSGSKSGNSPSRPKVRPRQTSGTGFISPSRTPAASPPPRSSTCCRSRRPSPSRPRPQAWN